MKSTAPLFKIATWNVNSVGVRLERLLKFLERENPDVVCLQELKCMEEKFPREALLQAGYHATVCGQKTYNGVAILSKEKPEKVWVGIGDGDEDTAARLVGAKVAGLTAISVYVPNGQEVGSEKYAYKLKWMKRLRNFLDANFSAKDPVLVCGDYNVAPEDRDVYDPILWEGKILFSQPEKEGLKQILNFGLKDTFRHLYPEEVAYSWWDYRQMGFQRNLGMRIDFILGSEVLIKESVESRVDRNERKGQQPSDHAPVIATFHWPKKD